MGKVHTDLGMELNLANSCTFAFMRIALISDWGLSLFIFFICLNVEG